MQNGDKTTEQLRRELADLRHRVTELQASESKLKQAEKALQRSEAKTRVIVDAAVDGIITINETGIIASSRYSVIRQVK